MKRRPSKRPPRFSAPLEPCYVCTEPAERERELISIRMAMRICQVSRSTIKRWMRRGKIQWTKLASGIPRIYADSLVED